MSRWSRRSLGSCPTALTIAILRLSSLIWADSSLTRLTPRPMRVFASPCAAVSVALRSAKPWARASPASRTPWRLAADSGASDSACQLPQNSPSRLVMPVSPGSSMTASRLPSASARAPNCPTSEVAPRKLTSANWSRSRVYCAAMTPVPTWPAATGMLSAGCVNGVAAAMSTRWRV